MARPSKPYEVIIGENKSHRTKAELKARAKGEAGVLTGKRMKEQPSVKKDKAAHDCFVRIRGLLWGIGKDDALYEGVINRYCLLRSEELRLIDDIENQGRAVAALDEAFSRGETDADEYLARRTAAINAASNMERILGQKRTMLLAIEKENIMTIAGALRGVPKQPAEEDDEDPMDKLLSMRQKRA